MAEKPLTTTAATALTYGIVSAILAAAVIRNTGSVTADKAVDIYKEVAAEIKNTRLF